MDKRWRNLGGLVVIIVLVFLVLNFNNFIKLPFDVPESDSNIIGLDDTEKAFLKISDVFIKNDINIQTIRYLDNIQYTNNTALFASNDSSLTKAKNELVALKDSDEISEEGKSVANIYINAIDLLIFEKKLTIQLKDLEKSASSRSCDNIDLMVDANNLIFQRFERVLNLYDLVQVHSVEYDWTSEVIVIDSEREEASLLMFADEANAFIESCNGGSN